ncbi:MAG: histidine phosphatase family protein [Oscillospiraceae bacterium]|jgi:alpha-ribazole phosphatase|nr:histidine phosphatase family protein [Oscillospiraceae bacterium]
MELILLRHAKTAGNLVKRYIGKTDEKLAPEGVAEASALVDRTIGRVYVSPLRRAVETAEIRFPGAELVICEDLREMDFGDFEGLSANEMAENPAYLAWVEENCEPAPPGASEDFAAYSERVCRAIAGLVKNETERVVAVTHGGAIMAAMSRWAKPERAYYLWNPPHCGGYAAEIGDDWDGSGDFISWRKL